MPRSLRSYVVYKFTCAECNSVYVGETSRHISTRFREHLFSDKNSHIFKHLQGSDACKNACNETCFKVIDSARTHCNIFVFLLDAYLVVFTTEINACVIFQSFAINPSYNHLLSIP